MLLWSWLLIVNFGDSMPTFFVVRGHFFFSFFFLRHVLWSGTDGTYGNFAPIICAFLDPCSMNPVPGNLDESAYEEAEG